MKNVSDKLTECQHDTEKKIAFLNLRSRKFYHAKVDLFRRFDTL
jgi:hypothetical protein